MLRAESVRGCESAGVAAVLSTANTCQGRRRDKGEFFTDNLLVRIHVIIVMIRCTGLAPWEFELPFPGSLRSIVLGRDTCHAEAVYLRRLGTCYS